MPKMKWEMNKCRQTNSKGTKIMLVIASLTPRSLSTSSRGSSQRQTTKTRPGRLKRKVTTKSQRQSHRHKARGLKVPLAKLIRSKRRRKSRPRSQRLLTTKRTSLKLRQISNLLQRKRPIRRCTTWRKASQQLHRPRKVRQQAVSLSRFQSAKFVKLLSSQQISWQITEGRQSTNRKCAKQPSSILKPKSKSEQNWWKILNVESLDWWARICLIREMWAHVEVLIIIASQLTKRNSWISRIVYKMQIVCMS